MEPGEGRRRHADVLHVRVRADADEYKKEQRKIKKTLKDSGMGMGTRCVLTQMVVTADGGRG